MSYADRDRRRRLGAVLSVEFLFVMPIISLLLMAIVEFSLLFSARHRLEAASLAACRVATLPASDPDELDQAVQKAAQTALAKRHLIAAHQLSYWEGPNTGDPVLVHIQVPMNAAAPNLLALVGFSLEDRWLTADTVMRKE